MVQALSTDKSHKYNLMQTLVYWDCHQLPKPHMGAPCPFTIFFEMPKGVHERLDFLEHGFFLAERWP
jgi:hypothetical protein